MKNIIIPVCFILAIWFCGFLLHLEIAEVKKTQRTIIENQEKLLSKEQPLTSVNCLGVEPVLNHLVGQQQVLLDQQKKVNFLLNLK